MDKLILFLMGCFIGFTTCAGIIVICDEDEKEK